ncbi:MAG: glycerol-3-phosphate 1-O-acyltransferase PlsY [Verrucomicrobiota bacterium]
MTNVLIISVVIVSGYLIGSIPFGLFIGMFNGVDVRRYGSGNIGATNISRVIGRNWGITCFVLDFCKGLLPVLIVSLIFRENNTVMSDIAPLAAAGAAIAGHICPVFLKFRGGKGMSTSLGALLALSPPAVLLAMAGWYIIFTLWRYVSLASIFAALLLPVGELMGASLLNKEAEIPKMAFLILICAIVIWRHKSNIKRLLEGRENRFVKEKTE